MTEFNTKYGLLKGIVSSTLYSDGSMKECIVEEYNELETPCGMLVPQYDHSEIRRKYTASVYFYKNGQIQSIALHNQTLVKTPSGSYHAELLTFYECGSIKRLFPLNGKVTGYWTEEDEYGLAAEYEFNFPFGSFIVKTIGIYFYEDGAIKSLTFWPGNTAAICFPLGVANVRNGISFYQDGSIKSLEPDKPYAVSTPIGRIFAYDAGAVGIHGDTNSLSIDKNGEIISLATSTDVVLVQGIDGRKKTYSPGFKESLCDDAKIEVVPLKLNFHNGYVRFNGSEKDKYELGQFHFITTHYPKFLNFTCGDCSSCDKCG